MCNMKRSWVIPAHLSTNVFSLPTTGIILLLSPGLESRVPLSWYSGLGMLSFGNLFLPMGQSISPKEPTFRGPSSSLGSQPPDWVSLANGATGKPSMLIAVEGTFSCRSGGLGMLFFCAFWSVPLLAEVVVLEDCLFLCFLACPGHLIHFVWVWWSH